MLRPRPTGLLRPVSSEGPAHTPALPRSPPLYRTSKHTSLQRPCSLSTVLLVCRAPSLNCDSSIQICRLGAWPKSCNLQSQSMFFEFTFISSLFFLIKMNFFFSYESNSVPIYFKKCIPYSSYSFSQPYEQYFPNILAKTAS